MKKLDLAIEYMKRMAEGNNPVTNQPEEKDSILNNANVVRCFYYVTDILKMVREGGMKGSKVKKCPFPFERLNSFEYRKDNTISHIVNQINESIDERDTQKITYSKIIKGLTQDGYLMRIYNDECQKEITWPTEKGRSVGIYCERREKADGTIYYSVVYGEQAQLLIVKKVQQYSTETK